MIHTADAVWAEGVRQHLGGDETVHVVVAACVTPWVREVLAAHAAESVVLVVGDLTDRDISDLGRSGVDALLPLEAATAEALREVVARVARGPSPLVWTRHGRAGLSAREIRLLRLLAEGAGNEEAAAALGLSDRMVKRIVSAVIRRHGLRNRAQAVAYAIRNGCI